MQTTKPRRKPLAFSTSAYCLFCEANLKHGFTHHLKAVQARIVLLEREIEADKAAAEQRALLEEVQDYESARVVDMLY